MSTEKRIALGGILTECNHFGGVPITLDWFERYELLRGEEILQSEAGVVGGMLQVLRPEQVRWRSARSKRPWLAGTVVKHMCAEIAGHVRLRAQ